MKDRLWQDSKTGMLLEGRITNEERVHIGLLGGVFAGTDTRGI